MPEAHVLRIELLPVVDRGNGIQTIPLVTKELGSKQLTTGITRFPVGAKVPMHSHNCDEQVTILEGEAEADSTAYVIDSTLTTRLRSCKQAASLCECRRRRSRFYGFILPQKSPELLSKQAKPSLTFRSAIS